MCQDAINDCATKSVDYRTTMNYAVKLFQKLHICWGEKSSMKRSLISTTCFLFLLTSVGCSNGEQSQSTDNKPKNSKIQKHKSNHKSGKKHSKAKVADKKKKRENKNNKQQASEQTNDQQSATSQNQQQSQPQNNQTTQQQPSQSDINRARGYDPNGNAVMPGQDHAPGSNPDGTPDPWVQGQIDWEKENGYLNPDGTPTQKGQQADDEVNANASYDSEQQ